MPTANSCVDMNSNYYLRIFVSRAPALSTGHNVAFGWRATCHVLKMLYYLWSERNEFIENHCCTSMNVDRGHHCLLTTFERPAWGHNPKSSHMSWCPQSCPVNFFSRNWRFLESCMQARMWNFFKGGKSQNMWDEISMLLRNKIYDAKIINGFLQKWDRNLE